MYELFIEISLRNLKFLNPGELCFFDKKAYKSLKENKKNRVGQVIFKTL